MIQNLPEAKAWLSNNKNKQCFAGNEFESTEKALEFVNEIYSLGAVEIFISQILDEPWRIKEEGGPYADTLIIKLPTDSQQRKRIFDFIGSNIQDNGQESITLWWD